MLKTPASFRSSKKRNPSLLKVFKKGGTAPNTPEEETGVTVVANEFDPSLVLSPLSLQNIPSPLRGDASRTVAGTQSSASYRGEERKEESPDDDVVSKTLNFFDDFCAVQKTPYRPVSSITTSTIKKQSEIRNPHLMQEPSYLVDDEDEDVTTNPSLPSGFSSNSSLDRYSNSNGSSLNKLNQNNNNKINQQHQGPKAIPKSPTHDHENFEVVLDPNSLLKEERTSKPVKRQQRVKRWPRFSAASLSSSSSQKKEKQYSGSQINNTSVPASAPAIELRGKSPVATKKDEMPIDEKNALLSSSHEQEADVKIVQKISEYRDPSKLNSDNTSGGNGKRSKVSVKKIWKRVIPILQQKEQQNRQHHRAEVDNEAAVARSLEKKREILEEQEFLQQGCPNHNVEPILEEGDEDEDESAKDEKNPSMTSAWKNIYTSITNTLDPEFLDADLSGTNIAASTSNSEEAPTGSPTLLKNLNEEQLGGDKEAAVVESVEVATPHSSRKVSNTRSLGQRLKNIQKNAYSRGSKKDVQSTKAKHDRTKENGSSVSTKTVKRINTTTMNSKSDADTEKPYTGTSNELPKKPKVIWKAVVDSRTGKTYYYHRKTRETTWTKPDGYKRYEVAHKKWVDANAKQAAMEIIEEEEETKEEERPSTHASARSASWPKSSPPSEAQDLTVIASGIVRIPTSPVKQQTTIISHEMPDSPHRKNPKPTVEEKDIPKADESNVDNKVAETEEVTEQQQEKKTDTKPFDESKPESKPFDESEPFDEPQSTGGPDLLFLPRSPQRFGNRSMTYQSKASANTRSSALTDRTEKIKNTAKGGFFSINPIKENMSTSTSISTRNDDERERFHIRQGTSPTRRVPSRVPVPRERQLMVEELTDARISAESYEGNAGEKRGRIVRGRATHEVETSDDVVYDGDNDTEEDCAASNYDNDTYGTDSVSALSENDTDFLSRRDNFDQARRRALDAAIEIEDWDLAAALSDGMRAANLPGGYEKAHSSWNQSELDKFIANNDWTAVKSYIARMREVSKKSQQDNNGSNRNTGQSQKASSTSKSIGASSKLQHKELMSESSWSSDSHSSYESYTDSEV